MDLFAYLLLPTTAPANAAERHEEAEAMTEHFLHLQRLRQGRVLQLAGVGGQADFGLVVFEAESIASAEVTMSNDPLVAGGLMTGICVPFQVVLRGEGAAAL